MNSFEKCKNKIIEKTDKCPLCYKLIELDKLILINKCGHLFHINCILKEGKNYNEYNEYNEYTNKFICKLCFE
jgi:hypothetical protein